MEKNSSTHLAGFTNCSARLPDLGTLWMHERYGLCIYLGAEPLTTPADCSSLYTVYVLIVRAQHNTEGIFAPTDWHEQFTPV